MREALERGQLALPPDEMLFEELLATTWSLNPSGKIALDAKDTIRVTLGRSPDRSDALVMALSRDVGVPKENVPVTVGSASGGVPRSHFGAALASVAASPSDVSGGVAASIVVASVPPPVGPASWSRAVEVQAAAAKVMKRSGKALFIISKATGG